MIWSANAWSPNCKRTSRASTWPPGSDPLPWTLLICSSLDSPRLYRAFIFKWRLAIFCLETKQNVAAFCSHFFLFPTFSLEWSCAFVPVAMVTNRLWSFACVSLSLANYLPAALPSVWGRSCSLENGPQSHHVWNGPTGLLLPAGGHEAGAAMQKRGRKRKRELQGRESKSWREKNTFCNPGTVCAGPAGANVLDV